MTANAKHNTINKRFLSYENGCGRTVKGIGRMERVLCEMLKEGYKNKTKGSDIPGV